MINKNMVYYLDCIKFMESVPDGFYDLAIPDIPYGINVCNMPFLNNKQTRVIQKNGNKLNPHKNKLERINKNWDNQTPKQYYFNQLKRISKDQILFGIEYVDWEGITKGRILWNKMVPQKLSFKGYELAYCSFIDYTHEIKCLWSGMRQAKSKTNPTVQQGNKKLNEKRIHPTQKPIVLYEMLIDFYLNHKKNNPQKIKIFDSHVGSGSLRIACLKQNIYFEGCELDEKHYQDQENRFNEYEKTHQLKQNQLELF